MQHSNSPVQQRYTIIIQRQELLNTVSQGSYNIPLIMMVLSATGPYSKFVYDRC